MPELPHVEVFRRYVESTALHAEVEEVEVLDDAVLEDISKQRLKKKVEGRKLTKADQHGKWLFLRLDEAGDEDKDDHARRRLVMHFGMSGTLRYGKDEGDLPEHTAIVFRFDDGRRLCYVCPRKLGKVALTDDIDTWLIDHDVGPDARAIMEDTFVARLRGHNGMIKTALMDQSKMAGIGNEMADEILFHTHIHPETPADSLERRRLEWLYHTTQSVLQEAIDALHGGKDGDVLGHYPQEWMVSHRDDMECPRCGGAIENEKVGGRSTYFCLSCIEIGPEPPKQSH